MNTRTSQPSLADLSTWLACAVLALLYIIEVWAMTHIVRYTILVPGSHGYLRLIVFGAALLQTGALWWLFRSLRDAKRTPWLPLVGCAVILTVASFLFTNPSGDSLAYIAYAKLPTFASAYHIPQGYVPPRGFGLIAQKWPVLPRSSYGPLWLLIARLTVGPAPTLASSMFILRITGLLFLCLIFASAIRLRATPAITALLLANPFFYFTYVLEAHNDVMAIGLVMGAMALASRQPLLAAIVSGLAAVVKAPFILVGLLPFARDRIAARRVPLQIAIVLAVGIGGSLFGGAAYFNKLIGHEVGAYSAAHSTIGVALSWVHILLAVVAVAAIYAAVARGTYFGAASFSFVALSAFPYPQYLTWALPYVWGASFAAPFLTVLPAISALMQSQPASQVFELVVLIATLWAYALHLWRARPATVQP